MAFEVPSHLPRSGNPLDISSNILSKVDEATAGTLTASHASSWLADLDETISLTKKRIHERIHDDLPNFERQLSSAKSVRLRLESLAENVGVLDEKLTNSESGLIPTLVRSLSSHATLKQASSNATITRNALEHLHKCRSDFRLLSQSIEEGKLPDAVNICTHLEAALHDAPAPLNRAQVMTDLKRQLRIAKDRTEEQLSDAYSRSVVASPSELFIRPSAQIRNSDAVLPLPAILSSLSTSSLTAHLSSLRRALTTHYIDHVLSQPTSIIGAVEKLTLFPSPPSDENRLSALHNISVVLDFLSANLFPSLPDSQKHAFPRSLCTPVTTAVLHHLLIPSLPSSLADLPPYLELVKQAVEFEDRYIVHLLGSAEADREIKAWADGVGGHYERKRRVDILENARTVITSRSDDSKTFRAEVESEAKVIPVQANGGGEEDSAWGLETEDQGTEEDGWGLDEDIDVEPEPPAEDSADSWGWNEEAETPVAEAAPVDDEDSQETAWDDPWDDEPAPDDPPPPPPPITSPKPATRLEKFSAKGKSPQLPPDPPSATSKLAEKRPAKLSVQSPPSETYTVSLRMKNIAKAVEDALREGKEYSSAKLFPASTTSGSAPGTLLLQAASSIPDLYRALHPVIFNSDLASSPSRSMRFSNDCLYLSAELAKTEAAGHFDECRDKLKILGDSWFEDTIEQQRQLVNATLDGAENFVDTADQDRYDECESVVSKVLRDVRALAQQWKGVLAKGKYFTAIGQVVDSALSRILDDVLALPDIPEAESHRLSELSKILNALEGLFVGDDPAQPSFVVAYVPSWLKYSYLSELLEASIADISYLFDEGALVDFELDELVKLIRALFADTPLRATTINKILSGHPDRS
ncbi:hypothetical protein PLICRDRAFT_112767 [Plicaturopsis crispa FD-325 SS-3]|nr:hypothetical protein PLICRDRAFT_112767 [Plicaturopsis crispa FD-325 SS-3]